MLMTTVPTKESPQAREPTILHGSITVDYLRTHPTCSVTQAAELLGVSREYGYQLVKSGKIDAIKLGEKRFRVKSVSLLRLLGVDEPGGAA
jgi:excisionase family DNA binding protein